MFQKLYSRLFYILTRFILYFLFKRRESKFKKSRSYEDVNSIMGNGLENLIKNKYLQEDLTKGPNTAKIKNGKRLISAFVANRNKKDEDEFYIQVAKEWVKGYEKKFHSVSLIFIILFLLWWASGIFLNQYISNITGLIFLLGIFLFPIFGFIFAGFGKGWKKWLLAAINVFCFMVFVAIVL